MKRHTPVLRHVAVLAALGATGAVLTLSTPSFAGDTTVVQTPPPAQPNTTVVNAAPAEHAAGYTGPNTPMIATGLVTFGLAYVPALVVAGESTQDADHNLYVPIAGPWLDIANRPACGASNQPDCTTENTDKVLIGVDGVFQGVGAVMTVIGLLTPETHETVATSAKADTPKVQISPARLGPGGYGLTAVGSW